MINIVNSITPERLARYFDHTQLHADAITEDFVKLCNESKKYNFKMVAINSAPVSLCKKLLKGTDVNVGAAISFPLGQSTIETKLFETTNAISNGADEIDYVINIAALKEKKYDYIEKEMAEIVKVCRESNVLSKVIFENCYLTRGEKEELCKISLSIKPDFIKTSTGFGTGGATVEDVRLMKSIVKDNIKIKAAGGIRTLEHVFHMIEAGAERIGSTSSVAIIENLIKIM